MLEITPTDVQNLPDDTLRTLIGRLCEAELQKQGLSPAAVTWGGNQDAADGGIDVRVQLPADATIDGYVPRRSTGFQVKKPDLPESAIANEMRPNDVLRPSIQELVREQGAYIIACSSGSVADKPLAKRRRAMRQAVADQPYGNKLHVDFYDRTRIASWVRQHPGLIPWTRRAAGREIIGWQSFGPWANPNETPQSKFLTDTKSRIFASGLGRDIELTAIDGINRIRSLLIRPGTAVRLVGLSGVGKTRLVQALFDKDVGVATLDPALTIYTNMSDDPIPPPIGMVSDATIKKSRLIFIIDNCPSDLHQRLVEICTGSTVSVITVEYDIRDDQPEGTEVFSLEPASNEMIAEILSRKFPRLSRIDADRVADFSGGNFRVALALARTVDRGDSVSRLNDAKLFERLFWQRQKTDEKLLRAAQVCSLLYSFNGEDITSNGELARLGMLVGQSADELFSQVAELKRRDLVQARGDWRAVLPHAIANRLAGLALENIHLDTINDQLVHGAPDRVRRSFSRRIGYLNDNVPAQRLVNQWLAHGGILSSPVLLNEVTAEMFVNVAPVAPNAILDSLETDARGANRHAFLKSGQRFVDLLRSLAFETASFDRVAALLVELAVAHSGDTQNDAANAFESLFFAYLSGTHATVEQRVAVMRHLVHSASQAERELGLMALRALLEASHFSSSYSFEFGSRSRDFGYRPNFREAQDWYRSVLAVAELLANSKAPFANSVRESLASAFRGIWARARLFDDLERVVLSLSSNAFWASGWVAIRETLSFDSDRLNPESTRRLTKLEKQLRPKDLVEKVRAIVLSSGIGGLDFADVEDNSEDPGLAWQKTEDLAEQLGVVASDDPQALSQLLQELHQGPPRVFRFGRGLSSSTKNPLATWITLRQAFEALPENSRETMLFRGFLSGLSEVDTESAAEILDSTLSDELLGKHYVMLQSSVPIDARGIERLLRSLELGIAPIDSFRSLAYGRAVDLVPGSALADLLTEISSKPNGAEPALEIVHFRLSGDKSARRETDLEILTVGRELLCNMDYFGTGHREDHYLRLIVEQCLVGSDGESAARIVCEKFKTAVVRSPMDGHTYDDFFQALCRTQPRILLDTFFSGDAEELHAVDRAIRWIGGHRKNVVDAIPDEILIEWCNQDPTTRYNTMAIFVSFVEGSEEELSEPIWTSLAKRIIENAPDSVQVVQRFVGRFRPTGWSGSLASILESRLKLLEDLQKHENTEIALIAATEIPRFRVEIERERQWEQDRDRERDQRFE